MKITGKVVCNTGDFAVVLLTDDDFCIVRRGHTPGFLDLFVPEFENMLKPGIFVTATLRGKNGILIAPLKDGERFARTTAKA